MKAILFSQQLLKLVLANMALPGVGDVAGLQPSAAPGNLYLSLHTADPAGGDQATAEAAYAGYARVAIARTGAQWNFTDNTAANAVEFDFPQCTAGNNAVAHGWFALGTAASGAGALLYSGALSYPLNISRGIQPLVAIGAATLQET